MNNIPKLFELASAAMKNAYAPYSRFAVGAAVLSGDGRFYAGCNVENVSYPCGSCAETGAIAAMIAGGSVSPSAATRRGTPFFPPKHTKGSARSASVITAQMMTTKTACVMPHLPPS